MDVLSVQDVSFRYQGTSESDLPALRNVSFSVRAGECFGIVGPNGGGKSTLFQLISTALPLQSGKISVLTGRNSAEIRAQLGVVFQNPALDKQLTVRENLETHAALFGIPKAIEKPRMASILSALNLADRAGQKVKTLSGGLQRRVEIAKALLVEPKILLLDEPTTGLDPLIRNEIWGLLHQLRKEKGITLILTTHFLEEAMACDRILFLHKGQALTVDTPQNIINSLGHEFVIVETSDKVGSAEIIQKNFHLQAQQTGNQLRIQTEHARELIPKLIQSLGDKAESVSFRRPTLEDFFVKATGGAYVS